MSAQDRIEKILRQLHVILSKSEPYKKEPTKVIVDKQEMLDLLAELNTCMYTIMDEYELTQRSRDKAEREFKKRGDEIVWDASRKAEDIYAASVMYTDEALNRVYEIMQKNTEQMEMLFKEMKEKFEEQEQDVKSNKLELKSQLQGLVDTEKYLKLIEARNKEIKKQKEEGKDKSEAKIAAKKEASIYANRQTEVKVNEAYLQALGLSTEENIEEEVDSVEETSKANEVKAEENLDDLSPEELKEREEQLRADLDADYFNWKEENEENTSEDSKESKEGKDLAEGIQKMWKSIKSGKNK